jgi:hypothetical protein
MTSTTLSCSISLEHANFLRENPDFSASKILQEGISQLMQNSKDAVVKMRELNATIQRITSHRDKLVAFIDERGILDEFLQEK